MTKEEIMALSEEDLEARAEEIRGLTSAEGVDLDALKDEVDAISERRAQILETRKAAMADIVAGAGEVIEHKEEKKPMTELEIRQSAEYIDAYAKYIKSGDDRECRSLLTTDASGVVPVPTLVDEIIRTAWEKNDILSRVRRTFIRGNLKIAFERSADGAYVHNEGTTAPTEESLTLGIVTMIPKNIKKWITISDEALTMGGEAFLRYVYDELTYQITKKLAALVVTDIKSLNTSAGSSYVSGAKVTGAPSVTIIGEAFANLSDEAQNPVIIMNKLTYANFLAAQAAGYFNVDPFMGLPVLFNSEYPAYSTASANAVYASVGDLQGAQINFPEGDDVVIKWDDLSLAERDMVKVVGRQYAAHAVTACGRFTNIAKPSGT